MKNTALAPASGMTTAEIVARNLDRELKAQRWSARQAAFKLGLNPMYVTRRTSGEVECTASDLVMFAGLLSIPVTALLEETPETRTKD